ncbi:serine hydrolase [Paenibacillus sp. D2_2]|uniref:serine hydrolase n=1 Tax=Paenibacillus sp. D2_2 TaxID=3073092 RepID=UPI0028151CCE|nr:serine hydrolase [Paenibacillus sp. D2_2]WMT39215.1 serine hydrolase [Paenibacillus sp. D2_2]
MNKSLRRAVLLPLAISSLLLGTLAGASTQAYAQSSQITKTVAATDILLNGSPLTWTNSQPFIYKGTTYVPLRETAEQMGAEVKWNKSKRASEIMIHGNIIDHRPETSYFTINGYTQLQAPGTSLLRNGSTMVPLRTLAEVLGATVTTSSNPVRQINLLPDNSTIIEGAAALADEYLIHQQFSGIALIADHGEVQLRKGYGLNGPEKLISPDDKSRIASLTKGFTAAAIMKLEEEGKLHLDDTLESYIPGFPQGNEITLHMLLSHTSGLASNFPRTEGLTLEQTIETIKGKPLVFTPGTDFKYSNSGYMLLGRIIELVSGMSYTDFIQSHFIAPLHMTESGIADQQTRVIKGYVSKSDQWALAGPYYTQPGSGDYIQPLTIY